MTRNRWPQWQVALRIQLADERDALRAASTRVQQVRNAEDCREFKLLSAAARARLEASHLSLSEVWHELEEVERWLNDTTAFTSCPIN